MAHIWFSGFRAIIMEAHEYCKGGRFFKAIWYTCFVSVLKYVHRVEHIFIHFYFSTLSLKLHMCLPGWKKNIFIQSLGLFFLQNISKLWYRLTKNYWNLIKFWFTEESIFFSKILINLNSVLHYWCTWPAGKWLLWILQLNCMVENKGCEDLLENLQEKILIIDLADFF